MSGQLVLRKCHGRGWLPALLLTTLSLAGWAQPYRPATDAEVLEQLPRGWTSGAGTPDRMPQNRAAVLTQARQFIALGRMESDPRYYGHAEGLLAPLLEQPEPEPDALVLMATVWQNRHDFPAALQALDRALQLNPRFVPAWLLRASILEVQGDYAGALRNCLGLSKLGIGFAAAVCLDSGLSLSGQAQTAYRQLQRTVAQADAPLAELRWARVTLAEMAERLGQTGEAERWYREALALAAPDAYLLATFADFLLQQHRAQEVTELLADMTRADPLLLRLTLAERQLAQPQYREHMAQLAERFQASRARGDKTHRGDESRYWLQLQGDAEKALTLAEENWSVQREPRDARVLIEAALAAGRPAAMQGVLQFLRQTRLEDRRLDALLAAGGVRP